MKSFEKNKAANTSRAVAAVVLAAASGVLWLGQGEAKAQQNWTWQGANPGNWNVATNWVSNGFNGVPSGALGDTVSFSGNSNIQVTDAQSILRLTVGSGSTTPGFLTVSPTGLLTVGGSGAFGTGRLQVASNGNTNGFTSGLSVEGTVVFDSNTATAGLTIAGSALARGVVNVTGTLDYTAVVAGSGNGPRIGEFGIGTLNVSGSGLANFTSATNTSQLELGYNQGATSTVNVSGGTLNINSFNIRNTTNTATTTADAVVAVNISGGTVNSTSTAALIGTTGGSTTFTGLASLNLSGGTLILRSPLRSSTTAFRTVTWSGGTIQMAQASGTVTNLDNIVLGTGGSPTFNSNGTTNVMSGTLSGTGSLTKSGAGSLTLSGQLTNGGGLSVTGGTLLVTGLTNTLTGNVTVGSGATLLTAGINSIPAANRVTLQDASTIGSSGTGSTTFVNSVSLTGNIIVGTTPASTGRVVFGGTVDLTGGTRTIALASIGTNTTAGSPGRSLDLSSVVANGNLIISASTNTFATGVARVRIINGLTFNNVGSLTLDNVTSNQSANAALPANTNLILTSTGQLDTGDGASLRNPTIASLSGSGRVINSSAPAAASKSTLTVAGTATTTFSGVIADGTQVSPLVTNEFTFSSTTTPGGQLTLTGSSTYTGPTIVNGGILKIAAGGAIASRNLTVNAGGIFDIADAYPGGFPIIAGSTFTYNGTVIGALNNSGTIRYNSASNGTINNNFLGTGGFLKNTNPSTLTLTGSSTFPAAFRISQGLVVVSSTATVSSNAFVIDSQAALDVSAVPSGLTVGAGTAMQMNGLVIGTVTIAATGTVNVQRFTTNNGDQSYPGNFTGGGALVRSDLGTGTAGTSTFTGNISVTGGVNTTAGTMILTKPLIVPTGSMNVSGTSAATGVLDPTAYANASTYSVAAQLASVSAGANGQVGVVSRVAVTPVARPANRPAVVVTSALTIGTDGGSSYSGFVDLGNSDMIVKGGNASLSTLRAYTAAWLGSGVTPVGLGSSSASPVAAPFTTIAVFSNNDGGNAYFSSYDGVALASNDVIAKFTYVGDTNLDGILDGADYSNIIEGLSTGGTGWQNGDVNYDGVVNAADVTAFQAALDWYTTAANNAPSYGNGSGESSSGGQIPEPASLGLLAAVPMIARRRRR